MYALGMTDADFEKAMRARQAVGAAAATTEKLRQEAVALARSTSAGLLALYNNRARGGKTITRSEFSSAETELRRVLAQLGAYAGQPVMLEVENFYGGLLRNGMARIDVVIKQEEAARAEKNLAEYRARDPQAASDPVVQAATVQAALTPAAPEDLTIDQILEQSVASRAPGPSGWVIGGAVGVVALVVVGILMMGKKK